MIFKYANLIPQKQTMLKDFKIAYPDPDESIYQTIPIFGGQIIGIIHANVKARFIIDAIVVFRPVTINNEIIYSRKHVFFKHLN